MSNQFFISDVSKNYNLRHHIMGKPSPIYLVIRVKEKQYKISLGIKVLPEHWNKCKAMVSPLLTKLDNLNNNEVNKKIFEYDGKYSEFIAYLCSNPEQLDNIDNAINTFKEVKKKENRPLAIAVLRTLLREKPMGDSSRKIFNQQLDNFYEYLKTLKKDIHMDDIDVTLMRNYLNYLHNSTCTHSITGETVYLEDNSVKIVFGNILTILGYAEKADMIDLSKIRKLKEKGRDKTEENQVYLNDDEFEVMKNIQLKDNLDIIRDLFLLQLELGQRFSDITELMGKKLSIKDNIINIIQKKTGTRVTIPLTPYAIEIIKKYNYILPNSTNNKMNIGLKEIGKLCGFNEMCECRESRNGKPYIYSVEKYKLIGTHTARRSFVSNNVKGGISTELIKAITGHKSGAFDRYNRVEQEDLARAFVKAKQGNVPSNDIPVNPEPPECQNKAVMGDDCNTLKKVLIMLGENPLDFIDIDDVEILYRKVILKENKICEIYGCDFKTLKEIFNSDMTIREKIELVQNLMEK